MLMEFKEMEMQLDEPLQKELIKLSHKYPFILNGWFIWSTANNKNLF